LGEFLNIMDIGLHRMFSQALFKLKVGFESTDIRGPGCQKAL